MSDPIARILGKLEVEQSTGCWVYPGKWRPKVWIGKGMAHAYAYRLMWERLRGPIPSGMEVCHRCDNGNCVNPSHLFLGTHRQNMQDMARKGRGNRAGNRGEINGNHKLTWAQVQEIRSRLDAGESLRSVARFYGVRHGTVLFIKKGVTWKGDAA